MGRESIAYPDFNDIEGIVKDAITHIYSDERHLIDNDANEWAIAAQFHFWVRCLWMRMFHSSVFADFDFDSEYNLMSSVKKQLAKKHIYVQGEIKKCRPDFVIHIRGKSCGKFLWVEIKKHENEGWRKDLARLKEVSKSPIDISPGQVFVSGYKYGLGILFHKREVRCEWFQDGSVLCSLKAKIDGEGSLTWM